MTYCNFILIGMNLIKCTRCNREMQSNTIKIKRICRTQELKKAIIRVQEAKAKRCRCNNNKIN